jgi:nicotinic acid mononucleotide adenylyltransferase
MNGAEMVVFIVAILAIASVLRTLFGGGHQRRAERIAARMGQMAQVPPPNGTETERLREEVRGLKERVAVLERLITDQSSASRLDLEFEKLKQMD